MERLSRSRRLALCDWLAAFSLHDEVVHATVRFFEACSREVPFSDEVVAFSCLLLACKAFGTMSGDEALTLNDCEIVLVPAADTRDKVSKCEVAVMSRLFELCVFVVPPFV
mgnify:CR=1 FL=1